MKRMKIMFNFYGITAEDATVTGIDWRRWRGCRGCRASRQPEGSRVGAEECGGSPLGRPHLGIHWRGVICSIFHVVFIRADLIHEFIGEV